MEKQNAMAGLRHFFWDFDGTLFDTYPIVIEDLRRSLQEYGFDCDPEDAMRRIIKRFIFPLSIGRSRKNFRLRPKIFRHLSCGFAIDL